MRPAIWPLSWPRLARNSSISFLLNALMSVGIGGRRGLDVSRHSAIRRVKRLTLSLTWDHRVLDGAPAAAFVRTIANLLDDPTTLS